MTWLLGLLGLTGGGIGVAALLGGGPWMLAWVARPLWAWLCHRTFAQLCCMGLALACLALFVSLKAEQRHAHKVETQLSKVVAELNAISSKRNQQQVVTREKIKVVTQRIHDADGRAKTIEQAPLPGQCRTPPEIMGADL